MINDTQEQKFDQQCIESLGCLKIITNVQELRLWFNHYKDRHKSIDYRLDDEEKKLLSWGDILVSLRS
jgi:hypothetical protein